MKHAAAMKYGGELIAAVECNYDSFKELVPLCPECKEPVFLRVGGDRLSVKGKGYKVGSHWCHFKGVSAEQVASCESRVNGYSEKDKQRIAAKARGQRLKLLQRWFWRVWGDACDKADRHPLFMELSHGDHSMAFVDDSFLESFKSLLKVKSSIPANELAKAAESENYWLDTDLLLHDVKISQECIGFLLSKSSRTLFEELVAEFKDALFFHDRVATGNDEDGDSPYHDWNEDTEYVCDKFVSVICSIPWTSEFQRIESESTRNARVKSLKELARRYFKSGEFLAVNDGGASAANGLSEIPRLLRNFGFQISSDDGVSALIEAGIDLEELMQNGSTSMGVGFYDLHFYQDESQLAAEAMESKTRSQFADSIAT